MLYHNEDDDSALYITLCNPMLRACCVHNLELLQGAWAANSAFLT